MSTFPLLKIAVLFTPHTTFCLISDTRRSHITNHKSCDTRWSRWCIQVVCRIIWSQKQERWKKTREETDWTLNLDTSQRVGLKKGQKEVRISGQRLQLMLYRFTDAAAESFLSNIRPLERRCWLNIQVQTMIDATDERREEEEREKVRCLCLCIDPQPIDSNTN